MFRIYKGDTVIIEGESPLEITGIAPNTDVAKGEYQAVRVDGDKESERVDIPAFKTLPIEVDSVTVAPKTNNLEVDDTRQLNVTIEPSNATNQDVTYSSNNDDVATVNASGLITAVAEGTATITATVDGKTDTATVNVTRPPEITKEEVTEEIDIVEYETIRNETDEMPKGEEEVVQEGKNGYTLVTYEVTYEDGTEVSREETDREVIDPVDEIINVGTYEEPEPEPEPEVPEEGEIEPESIEINPKSHTFIDIWEPGTYKRFNVTILPEEADQEFTVESSDESVIRPSKDGAQAVGMSMKSGTAELIVKTVNGLTATATITVPEQG